MNEKKSKLFTNKHSFSLQYGTKDRSSDIEHGREEIENGYDNLMHKAMPSAKTKQEKGTIRMLTPELAIWQGGLEIQIVGQPPIKDYVVQVMKKVNSKWMILEGHPKLYPQSNLFIN